MNNIKSSKSIYDIDHQTMTAEVLYINALRSNVMSNKTDHKMSTIKQHQYWNTLEYTSGMATVKKSVEG